MVCYSRSCGFGDLPFPRSGLEHVGNEHVPLISYVKAFRRGGGMRGTGLMGYVEPTLNTGPLISIAVFPSSIGFGGI